MISHDAKVALANARQVAARRRLERDGALSREAIRRPPAMGGTRPKACPGRNYQGYEHPQYRRALKETRGEPGLGSIRRPAGAAQDGSG